jgi:hypothetical protein
MTLLWLADEPAYARARVGDPGLVDAALLATASVGLGSVLTAAGREWVSPWPHISLDDQLVAAEEALELVNAWLAWDWAGAHEVALTVDLCRTALLLLLRDGLLAGRMATRLLDAADPPDLALAGDDLLGQVLHWEAERRGLLVRTLDGGSPGSSGRSIARVLAAADTAVRWFTWRPQRSREPTVLFAGGGIDFLNQRRVVDRLRATRTWPVVHVALHPPEMAGRGGQLAALATPDLVLPAVSAPGALRALGSLRRQAEQALDHPDLPGADRFPWLLANPWLRPTFGRRFLDGLPRAGGAYGTAGRLMDRVKPGAVVLSNAASPRERALLRAARERGIPTVQLVHSGINDLHIHQVEADHLWVWGAAHVQQFAATGVAPARMRVVGSPALDPAPPTDAAATRRALGFAAEDIVFLLITASPNRLLAFIDPEGHAADLLSACEALADVPGARLVIKPHPRYDDLALYRRLAERYACVTLVEDSALAPLLAACDVAVALNAATTGALEAMLADRPLLWCCPSSRYPVGFDLIPPGALTVHTRAEIGPTLAKLAQSAEARATVAAHGRRYRAELLAVPPGEAPDAIAAALAELLTGV